MSVADETNKEDLVVVVSDKRHIRLFGALSTDERDPGNRVAQVKTGLSLNPFRGCPVGCIYCYRFDVELDAEAEKPVELHSPEEMFRSTVSHPAFVDGKTPLLLHTSTTEAFIPQTKAHTLSLLSLFAEHCPNNPIWIPTKAKLTERDIDSLEALKLPNLIISVTYSAMPKFVEPIGPRGRLETIRLLADSSLKCSLHYRPIVDGWNSDVETIDHVLEHGMKLRAITVGGLRISPGILAEFERVGIELPPGKWKAFKKNLSPGTADLVRQRIEARNPNFPWFLNTSCMISYLAGDRPDYNAHWQRPSPPCVNCGCPSSQKALCHNQAPPELSVISDMANRLGIEATSIRINASGIEIHGGASPEQLVSLRQQSGFLTSLANSSDA